MENRKLFLFFVSVVTTVTCVITMDALETYKNALLYQRNLAAKYVKMLQSTLGIGISTVSSKCTEDDIPNQFTDALNILSAFEVAMTDLRYECKISPPSIPHATTVVTMVNATQQVATYMCDTGYTYGGVKKKSGVTTTLEYGDRQPYSVLAKCFSNPSTYQGKKSTTQAGIECQRWDSQSPHRHHLQSNDFTENDISLAENYCRFPKKREYVKGKNEPWCFTIDTSVGWDNCGIPKCNRPLENNCGLPQVLTNTNIRSSYTSNGAMANYVCLALSGSTQNSYCPVSICTNTGWTPVSISCGENDCFRDSLKYSGKRNCTVSGRTCMQWSLRNPHDHQFFPAQFPENSLVGAGNYCRDPNESGTPWCYTTDHDVRWEYCNVPHCDTFL